MTWTPLSKEEIQLGLLVAKYIKTVKASGHPFYGENWYPCESDFIKSALFERLRSGKEPLPAPPPLGYSCPWYAVVEDPGPHVVHDVSFVTAKNPTWKNLGDGVVIYQNHYKIEQEIVNDPDIYIITHGPYRFKLWYDDTWKHPTAPQMQNGAWMLTNMAFVDNTEA